MNDAQRARFARLRDHYRERGMDVHGFDGEDNRLHVVVYGRITRAEIEMHTIAPDGRMDEGAESESVSRETWRRAGEPSEHQ